MTENIDAVCPGEGVMKTPDKSLAGCGESKERRNVCLTSQGSWGNKLHKERHKQKCKGAHERLAGADGAQKKVSDGSRLPTSVMVQLRPHPTQVFNRRIKMERRTFGPCLPLECPNITELMPI